MPQVGLEPWPFTSQATMPNTDPEGQSVNWLCSPLFNNVRLLNMYDIICLYIQCRGGEDSLGMYCSSQSITSQSGDRLDSGKRKEKMGQAKVDMTGYMLRRFARNGCQWQ